jgi:2-polyprenyl-6-methoxyphenol hydroxylase-like FAD-dependent oxidoreductase
MTRRFDAIVVGARCAGSPTAMLLARSGYRVLVVDRAVFPSDTISTHVIQPLGIAALARWGLLDRLVQTGCPAIHTYSFDFGPVQLSGNPGTDAAPVAYCPRRTILDKLLVDAAAGAGAEVREGFTVDEVLEEDGRVVGVRGRTRTGTPVTERASVVIGADGRKSRVAEAVKAATYREKPALLAAYYAYFSGLPTAGAFTIYSRPYRGFASAPTHDGLTMLTVGWPHTELDTHKHDVERQFFATLDLAPSLAERVRAAKRETPFAGVPVPNYLRKPFGPGWALVGDAGYLRDFITAQGIGDAFRDAERCARALDEFFRGDRPFDDYQQARDDAVSAMYEMTCELATLAPPPETTRRLIGGLRGNQPAVDAFMRMNAGTISPAEFFASTSVSAIASAASSG